MNKGKKLLIEAVDICKSYGFDISVETVMNYYYTKDVVVSGT